MMVSFHIKHTYKIFLVNFVFFVISCFSVFNHSSNLVLLFAVPSAILFLLQFFLILESLAEEKNGHFLTDSLLKKDWRDLSQLPFLKRHKYRKLFLNLYADHINLKELTERNKAKESIHTLFKPILEEVHTNYLQNEAQKKMKLQKKYHEFENKIRNIENLHGRIVSPSSTEKTVVYAVKSLSQEDKQVVHHIIEKSKALLNSNLDALVRHDLELLIQKDIPDILSYFEKMPPSVQTPYQDKLHVLLHDLQKKLHRLSTQTENSEILSTEQHFSMKESLIRIRHISS